MGRHVTIDGKAFDLEKLAEDAVNHRGQFVCTPREFAARYGRLDESNDREVAEASRLAVVCKDGMIRPR